MKHPFNPAIPAPSAEQPFKDAGRWWHIDGTGIDCQSCGNTGHDEWFMEDEYNSDYHFVHAYCMSCFEDIDNANSKEGA